MGDRTGILAVAGEVACGGIGAESYRKDCALRLFTAFLALEPAVRSRGERPDASREARPALFRSCCVDQRITAMASRCHA